MFQFYKLKNNNKNHLWAMKKFNTKLDLKSNLYKQASRSPQARTSRSKSPFLTDTKKEKNMQIQGGIRTKKFQNICCPNCRYLFRAPKQEIIFVSNSQKQQISHRNNLRVNEFDGSPYQNDDEENKNYLTSDRREYQKNQANKFANNKYKKPLTIAQFNQRTVETQTENAYTALKLTQKRQKTLSQIQTDRTPDKRKGKNSLTLFNLSENKPYYDSWQKTNPQIKNGQNTERQHRSPKFNDITKRQDLSQKKNVKSQFNTKQQAQRQKFPNKNIYLEQKKGQPITPRHQTSQTKRKKPEQAVYKKISTSPKNRQQTPKDSKQSKIINNHEINSLMDKIYLSGQIMDILEFNMDLAPDTMVPSYCKMLVYDLKDRQLRGSRIKKQEYQDNEKQGFFYS